MPSPAGPPAPAAGREGAPTLSTSTGASQAEVGRLKELARELRRDIVTMVFEAGSGHIGGSFSATEVIVSLYFGGVLRYDARKPKWPDRDRFVLSKGHATPILYSTLAHAGYFPHDDLKSFRRIDSHLQGHGHMRYTPGVEMTTGSLGQGFGAAIGMAAGLRLDGRPSHVYVMLGDGEADEGAIWEGAMAAAHYKLSNLTAVLDRNGIQMDGETEEVMAHGDLAAKWRAFGWHVIEVDGHRYAEIVPALTHREKERPVMVIAKTVKGKGVSFMEGNPSFHGKPPTKEQYDQALKEIEAGDIGG
ncbi:MAG TPA: transketolase [Candidatus Thermoplasmatota archaeon]